MVRILLVGVWWKSRNFTLNQTENKQMQYSFNSVDCILEIYKETSTKMHTPL